MKCPKCQYENQDNAKFCKSCGYKLEDTSTGSMPGSKKLASVTEATSASGRKAAPKTEILIPLSGGQTDNSATAKPTPSAAVCKNCGASMNAGAIFCSNCGHANDTPNTSPTPSPIVTKPVKEEKKNLLPFAIGGVAVCILLLGGGFFFLSKKDKAKPVEAPAAKEEEPENVLDEALAAELDEQLAPLAEQVADGEDKANTGDYAGASSDYVAALEAYASLAEEYDDSDAALDLIDESAAAAFELYTESILKQVEGWEGQSPTAPLYQQVDVTMKGSFEFADKLEKSGLTIDAGTLKQSYDEFPGRYKNIYIKAFNNLVSQEQWSRTTAWLMMQDAASVGLVDKSNKDDPLTLRYAFASAWITQKKASEGRNDGSMTDQDAVSAILAVIENADYNPVLIRELALCYESIGDAGNTKILKDASVAIYNYLANSESVYINGDDLFVPGNNTNASSTIPLISFWYFNDFGEFSPSITNGLKPEGREQVRTICKNAINSLQQQ